MRASLFLLTAVGALMVPLAPASAEPAAPAPVTADEGELLQSNWSLDKVRKPRKPAARTAASAARPKAPTAERSASPRIRAGVTAANGRNRTRAGAKVGIGLPF